MNAGAALARARQARGLSLEHVAQATKIQPWLLEALEADRPPESLPPMYLRAFVATYARFLGIDPPPIAPAQDAPVPPADAEPVLPPPAPPGEPIRLRIPWHWWVFLKGPAGVVAVVVGLVVFNPFRWMPKGSLASSRMRALASVTPVRQVPVPEMPPIVLTPTEPLELSVTAKATTWVRVRADGKLLTQQRLSRGAQEHWSAKTRLELVIAKPSQADLILNGQSISSFAIAHKGRLSITRYGVTKLPDDSF